MLKEAVLGNHRYHSRSNGIQVSQVICRQVQRVSQEYLIGANRSSRPQA